MFNFAKQLVRNSMSTPTKAKIELVGEFFVLEGERWQPLSEGKCTVEFDERVKGKASMTIRNASEGVCETIALESISNLARFVDENDGVPCFQWIVRKGKTGDNMEEFGLRFETESQANKFASMVSLLGQQTATVVGEFSEISLVEKVDEDTWEEIEDGVTAVVSKTKSGELYLSIEKGETLLFHSVISPGLQMDFEFPHASFVGLTPLSEDVRILALVFGSKEDFGIFQTATGSSVGRNHLRPSRASRAAPAIIAEEDVEMWEDANEFRSTPVKPRKTNKALELENKYLQMGRSRTERAVVFSEKKKGESGFGFQVFDVGGKKSAQISAFTNVAGLTNPTAAMIHEADAKVLLLDGGRREAVLELDLERGTVVNEWQPGSTVNAILPVAHSAQATGEKTFLGINDKSVFLMDPRVAGGSRVRSFNYATNVKLSAATTDKSGHLAIASKGGQIRLFDGEANRDGDFKRAKSLLPGLGDPITHVEVTSDGEWLLATCATYLVLMNTLGSSGESGFVISNSSGIDPIILAISPEDIRKFRLVSIAFRPAKFDEARDIILASTGSLAIVWDLGRIRRTGVASYAIKPMKDFILASDVVVGQSVVAMYADKLELSKVNPRRL